MYADKVVNIQLYLKSWVIIVTFYNEIKKKKIRQLIFALLHSMEMISICNMIHSVKLNCHFIGIVPI